MKSTWPSAKQPLQRDLVARMGPSLAPQRRREVAQPLPQRRRQLVVGILVEARRHAVRSAGQRVEGLPDEDRPGEVRRRRIGEAAGVRLCPVEQPGDRGGRVRDAGGVVGEGELRLVPRRLTPLDRHAEVLAHQGVVVTDVLHVRQVVGPAAQPGTGFLAGGEVVAVDPHQVHRALVLAGGPFGEQASHRVLGVRHRHPPQRDAEVGGRRGQHVVDVGVAPVVAAVHPQVHRLALRLGQHLVPRPVCRRRGAVGGGCRSRR